jgi:hypothetical protein
MLTDEHMSKLLPWRGRQLPASQAPEEPHPLLALAVGMVYLFRTAPGARILSDLERAIRRYANDPVALWHLARRGEDIVDTTVVDSDEKPLPDAPRRTLPR